MNFLKNRLKPGKYEKVTTEDDLNRAFTIADDEEDDDGNLTIDELETRHHELLAQASNTLKSTDGDVSWLQEEQSASVRAMTGDEEAPELPGMKRGCLPAVCGRTSSCTIM